MSCNYTRVLHQPEPVKSYGYNKVSRQELRSIVMRVQKPTHSSDQSTHFPDGYFKHPIRTATGYCERAQLDEPLPRPDSLRRRGISSKLLKSIVRRLQTPTISRRAATGYPVPQYDSAPAPPTSARPISPESRPKTSEESRKLLRRLTRPTRSSQRRDLDAFWQEIESSEYYYMDFSDDVIIGKEELESIIERVRTPTVASEMSEGHRCPKMKPEHRINRDKLPLVSGLSRSKKVEDIVNRLYRPHTGVCSKALSSMVMY